MRLSVVLVLFMCCISLAANAQDRKISVNTRGKEPLKEVLLLIERRSGYNIVYSDEIVTDTMSVVADARYKPVSEILDQMLLPHRLFYKFLSGNIIVIGRIPSGGYGKEAGTVRRTISGKLSSRAGVPVPFASVTLIADGAVVAGTTGSVDGSFSISYAFRDHALYKLKATCLGYRMLEIIFRYPDTAQIREPVMEQESNMLNSVTITASRPLVERRVDRYIVNVEGTVLADGNTGLEVLRRSPGVWVDNEGSIMIRGNQSVTIMINDVVQRMSQSDLAAYLSTLRSEDISKIEVIPNPPSEFEAEGSGGIIHIVLKKNRKDGLQGLVAAQYRQQEERPYVAGGITLDYKIKNLYLNANANVTRDESEYIANYLINYSDLSRYTSRTQRYNDNKRAGYRLGAVYDISGRQSVGIQALGNNSRMDQQFDTGIQVLTGNEPLTGLANSVWKRKPRFWGSTVNYMLKADTLGSVLKVIADYVYSTKTEINDFTSDYSAPENNARYRNSTPNSTSLYSIQADLVQVVDHDLQFSAGVKYVATGRDNEVLNEDYVHGAWVKDTLVSNRFVYDEQLLMGYISAGKTIGKISLKLGLRAEQTYMEGNSVTSADRFDRKYLNWFPSLYIMRQLNKDKGTSLLVNYSRRIRRPSYASLNPFRVQFDDYLTLLGNPGLMPEYTHRGEFTIVFPKGFTAEVYYSTTTNKIAELARSGGGRMIEYQTVNFSSSKSFGLTLNAPLTLAKWWSANTNAALFDLDYTINGRDLGQTAFYITSSHTFSFNKLFDADAWVNYRSPLVNANSKMAELFTADAGFSKKLLNNQARARLYVADVFNTFREKDFTEYDGTRINFYQKRSTRTFNLSISYNFSSGDKFNKKKIEQSNEDEKGRIGN